MPSAWAAQAAIQAQELLLWMLTQVQTASLLHLRLRCQLCSHSRSRRMPISMHSHLTARMYNINKIMGTGAN